MRTIKLLTCLLLLFPITLRAQDNGRIEELRQKILSYKKCFPARSKLTTTPACYTLSNGEQVNVRIRSDFGKESFMQCDPTLRSISFSLSDTNDDYISRNAEDIMNAYGQSAPAFHIIAHGITDPDGSTQTISIDGKKLNAEQAAELIIQQMQGYHHIINALETPFPIVIHSCNAAKGENSFAEQLSKRLSEEMLNVSVVAPPNVLYGQTVSERMPDGSTKSVYTETVVGETGFKSGPDAGSWDVFTNGVRSHGGQTYQSTLQHMRCE